MGARLVAGRTGAAAAAGLRGSLAFTTSPRRSTRTLLASPHALTIDASIEVVLPEPQLEPQPEPESASEPEPELEPEPEPDSAN